jgi:hypothetical protein
MEIMIVIVLTQYPVPTVRQARFGVIQNDAMRSSAYEKTAPSQTPAPLSRHNNDRRLLVVFGLQHFATTIIAIRANVVAQMRFTGGGLHRKRRRAKMIVRTVHTALGRGLLILLNGHDDS